MPWLVEGKLRYVELSLKGSKHVTQLHVGKELLIIKYLLTQYSWNNQSDLTFALA